MTSVFPSSRQKLYAGSPAKSEAGGCLAAKFYNAGQYEAARVEFEAAGFIQNDEPPTQGDEDERRMLA